MDVIRPADQTLTAWGAAGLVVATRWFRWEARKP